MRTAVCVLSVVASVAAVQVGFGAPAATSYVYRSDNDGPATLIRVGPSDHERPPAFGPLPLSRAIETYELAPVPLPYVNAKPIVIEDAQENKKNEDDDSYDDDDGSEELIAHGHESGDGSEYRERHDNAHGEKGSKGFSTKGHHVKGVVGDYGKAHNEGFYHNSKGEKGLHDDAADANGEHHKSGKTYKGGNRGHKKHFSKGEDVTGYHKVFHKDEYKKDHDFYDEAAKEGHFKKHDYHNNHHDVEKGAHEKGGHSEVEFNKGGFGKAGFHDNGYVDEEDEGRSAEEGVDSHYHHQEDYGKKGGTGHKKEYAFAGDNAAEGQDDD